MVSVANININENVRSLQHPVQTHHILFESYVMKITENKH